MKILKCHNFYQQPGGEDASFEAEVRLLESYGHEVVHFTLHNDAIREIGRFGAAGRTVWNPESHRRVRELVRRERPDVMHCTNSFPLLSPAVLYAAQGEGIPVVQSLRNYRLLCPNAVFLRNGRVCEDCLGRAVPWPGVRHACYRGDRAASVTVAAMLSVHRLLRTWLRAVDLYVAPSEFARHKFVEGGLPATRVLVKPNFVDPDPGLGTGRGGYFLFAGRLAEEKGVGTLLGAWQRLPKRVVLKVVGDGPLAARVREAACADSRIRWLGLRSRVEVQTLMGEASAVLVPSTCYETFGRTIVEAFARGTPVIASRLGAMAELVEEGRSGLRFEAGNAADLAARLRQALEDPRTFARMRRAARAEFERRYDASSNHRMLTEIYGKAAALRAERGASRWVRISRHREH